MALGVAWHRPDAPGGQQGGRTWRQDVELGCARVDTASSSWQKLGDEWQWVGWLGQLGRFQVSGLASLSVLSNLFCFSISDICFNLVFEPN